MLPTKKLIKMAKKWQRLAKASRRRISFQRTSSTSASTSSSSTEKGHFVVYTEDGKRFALPLAFLQSEIFRELLRLAEEEFGLTSDGPITLPCDSVFMDYAISIVRRRVTTQLENALILSMYSVRCSSLSSSLPPVISCC